MNNDLSVLQTNSIIWATKIEVLKYAVDKKIKLT